MINTETVTQTLRRIAAILSRQADDLENGSGEYFDALQTAHLYDLEPLMSQIVTEWRAAGGTWAKIGEAMNVSRQAAWERFS